MQGRHGLGAVGAALLVAGAFACSPNDPPGGGDRYSIATGGSGGVYQVYGGGLADLMTDELDDAPTTAETTSASVDNLTLVAGHDSDLAFTLSDTAIDAVKGEAGFDEPLDLRALATIYPNITQVAVKADSGIERIEDLKGKTVSVGSPNSGTEVIALRLLEVAGLDPDADIGKRGLGVGESVQALRDGSIDAFFWSGGVPDRRDHRPHDDRGRAAAARSTATSSRCASATARPTRRPRSRTASTTASRRRRRSACRT